MILSALSIALDGEGGGRGGRGGSVSEWKISPSKNGRNRKDSFQLKSLMDDE